MEIATGICIGMVYVTNSLYEVTVAGLAPLQLVLIGTTVEVCTFLFEVPTGVVADAYSLRLSIILGYILMGAGFLIEGFFPTFEAIVLSAVICGIGYTFTSGAKQAWITDEIGEERANQLFLRASRLGAYAWFLALGATLLIGADNVAYPVRTGAFGVLLIGIVLAFIMPENGFHPTPREDRNTWQHMRHIFQQGAGAVRSHPRLGNIVFIGLFYGLYSEGFDRLSVKLLVDHFPLPVFFGSNQVSFFILLEVLGTVLYIPMIRLAEERIDTGSPRAIGRAMLFVTAGITLSMLTFALSPSLFLVVASMTAVGLLRGLSGPLQTAWINQKLDSQVRATIHSMFGQVDAIGQVMGGPAVGLIANVVSVKLAISISSLLLSPALLFIRRANRIETTAAEPRETVTEAAA